MKQIGSSNINEIRNVFHQIPQRSYLERILYFERHNKSIDQLSFLPWIEIQIDYIVALFETGHYQKYLNLVDRIIELIIKENLLFYKGEDVFVDLLFKKAAALFNLDKTLEASEILIQVIKIDHTHPYATLFLQKCLHHLERNQTNTHTTIFIVVLIIAAALTAAELLWIKTFYPEVELFIEYIRNSTFLIGFIGVACSELYRIISIHLKTKSYVKSSKAKAARNKRGDKMT